MEASQERPERTHEHSEPLFAGSRVSTLEAYIMIFQYALRHHLTAKAFSELLLLLQVLLPAVNLLPKSLYLLKNFFLKTFPNISIIEHYYCQACHTPRDPASLHQCSDELCVSRKFHYCTNWTSTTRDDERYIIKQGNRIYVTLYCLVTDKYIWFSLKERLVRPNSEKICDVYDGVQYRKWKNFLNEPANVSLLLNTDGVAIFRSSKCSIWPVWIVINELPKSQRYNTCIIYIICSVLNFIMFLGSFEKTCYLLGCGIVGTSPP